MSQMPSELSTLEKPTEKLSISELDSGTPRQVEHRTDADAVLPLASHMSQNTPKSPCYINCHYTSTPSGSSRQNASFPYNFGATAGCTHAFIDNSEPNFSDIISFGGSPILTSTGSPIVAPQESLEISYTPILTSTPVTFIQGLAPNLTVVDSSNSRKPHRIWTGGPFVGTNYSTNSVVSPPNTPISHSQPVSFQYLAGNGPHNLSFDSFSIGQGMDDSLSTYDGSSVMPWGNCHETDIYSISPHYMTPPQQVMVANNSHFTSCTPMYHWPSPGPPIQMTPSNKGPEGANLFVFHIPNHFSNADLWNLFRPYGNVLSVRIMIEKDTGRSRGFGFVSYDVPEAAELAIKNLNGYAIGNKRLKVQHKQIRSSEQVPSECVPVSLLSLKHDDCANESEDETRQKQCIFSRDEDHSG